MSGFLKDSYDVVIIGSALAGMASALELINHGIKDILILEQHNLPGGIATSFVRSGVEMEATLHEMMSIGKDEELSIGKFFKENGIDISWVRVPDAYRYVDDEVNVLVHSGDHGNYENTAREISSVYEDKDGKIYQQTLDFLNMCHRIYVGMNYISTHKISTLNIIRKFPDVARIVGYSVKEVMDALHLPKKIQSILSAYWIYIGNRIEKMPMIIYAFMIADYLGYGACIPRHFSHEMSIKMSEKCLERGVHIEFGQRVQSILVENKKVVGIKTCKGDTIHTKYVISGAYPNHVYHKMISPKSEVPQQAIQLLNSKALGLSCFSVILLLDQPHEKLNIHDYSTFYAPDGLDFDKIEEGFHSYPYRYVTSICHNVAIDDVSPEGTTLYSITALPYSDSFKDITVENYQSFREKHARYLIDIESKRLGIDLSGHIKDLVIETPVSVSHYTHAFQGSVYGYQHSMEDNIVARLNMDHEEHYIHGLSFAGAHQVSGDGMGPAIANGRKAAQDILAYMKDDKGGK